MGTSEAIEFRNSMKQDVFLQHVKNGKNIFLSGKAGTGKSYITRAAIKWLLGQGKKVAALAPTGIAATNIGGATIHSTFGLTPFGMITYETTNFVRAQKRMVLNNLDVIIIDEVSMMRADMLDAMNWTLIKNGCGTLKDRQIIFIGDLKQLREVVDDNMKSVMLQKYGGTGFLHAEIYSQLNVIRIELDEILRQSDPEFIEALNNVRDGLKAPYFNKFLRSNSSGVVLAPHNATVQKYNIEGLNSLEGKTYTFEADFQGKANASDFNFDKTINVKDGCKIMYLANSKNNPLVNGTLGIFRVKDPGTEDERYMIEVEGCEYGLSRIISSKKEYVFNRESNSLELEEIGSMTQYPIKLAYALTIHKSQGLTIKEMTVDLTLPCFAEGQLYVAFSRVQTPEGLSIVKYKKS